MDHHVGMTTRGFTSDNASGAHPRVLAALLAAAEGHAPSYGADDVTAALDERVREVVQGPGGALYLLTDGDDAALLRLTPGRAQ